MATPGVVRRRYGRETTSVGLASNRLCWAGQDRKDREQKKDRETQHYGTVCQVVVPMGQAEVFLRRQRAHARAKRRPDMLVSVRPVPMTPADRPQF